MINTTSARHAITMAMDSGWRSPDLSIRVDTSSKGDTTPQILHGLDAGRVLLALDQVQEPFKSWLHFAYASPGWVTDAHVWRVQEELVAAYYDGRQVRQHGKISVMAIVCLGDMRARLTRGAPKLSSLEISRKVRFDQRNWDNGWSDNYAAMEAIIDGWDREGLAPIAAGLPRWTREALEKERQAEKERRKERKQAFIA